MLPKWSRWSAGSWTRSVSSIVDFFVRNWKLKLAALVMALLLWTSIRVESSIRQTLAGVPVRVRIEDPLWAMAGSPDPSTVELRLSGTARELLSLYRRPPIVVIPLDHVDSRDTTLLLRPEWVRLPEDRGLKVEGIEPPMVRLNLEEVLRTAVPLALRTRGSLPPGVALADSMLLDPAFVRVEGPRSRLDLLDSLRLEPLDLSGVAESGEYIVAVDTSAIDFPSLLVSRRRTTVTVTIEETLERVISAVPVVAEGGGEGGEPPRFLPLTIEVTISGARSRVERMDPAALRAMVRRSALEGLAGGQEHRVPIEIRGVPALLSAEPAVDSVTVRLLTRP